MSTDPLRVQQHLDADLTLGFRRLQQFCTAMLPIALAYEALFLGGAYALGSTALLGGAVAIAPFMIALLWARSALARGRLERAALLTGGGLLAMIAIGAVFLSFQLAALVLIGVAAIVVVIPHVQRRTVIWFAVATLAVISEVVVVAGFLPPLVEQPPEWLRDLVLVSSVLAAAILVIIMLTVDHERMRALVVASEQSAAVARAARDATDAFLIAAAHRLRTPISTVLLQAEGLLRKVPAGDPAVSRLERLVRQTRRLQHLVDEMLDVSRAGTGMLQIDRRTVDLSALVREVAKLHGPDAVDARVELEVDVPAQLTVHGDPERLALVTSNLLDNAIKFGAGHPARVAVHDDAGTIVLTVTDGGAGLAPEDRERCFERVARPPDLSTGGLGVGLWLVRELAQAMGGKVEAGPPPVGTGTSFVVRLPRNGAS